MIQSFNYNISSQAGAEADVVCVGGGPIGLWTAIQTKLNRWESNIVVLEKHSDYQRKHVLSINPKSLPKLDKFVPRHDASAQTFEEVFNEFKTIVKGFAKDKIIPTLEIENKLKNLAVKAGIVIAYENLQTNEQTGETTKPKGITQPEELSQYFPNAKVFIGADGAHSVVREKIFQDNAERTELQHVIQIKYHVKGIGFRLEKIQLDCAQCAIDNVANEHVGKYNKEEDKTPITTQIFIDKESFNKLEKKAQSGKPLNLREIKELDTQVADKITTWLNEKHRFQDEQIIEGSEQISVIPLGYYKADHFIQKEAKKVWALVGDAAFGVPFFRSLNNGLLCGTKLAKAVADYLKEEDPKNSVSKSDLFSKFGTTSFEEYQAYTEVLAAWEINIAKIKGFFVSVYLFILRLFIKPWIKASSRFVESSDSV